MKKKLLIVLTIIFLLAILPAFATNVVPDKEFRKVLNNYLKVGLDANNDSNITKEELEKANFSLRAINFIRPNQLEGAFYKVKNLEGIQYIKDIKKLGAIGENVETVLKFNKIINARTLELWKVKNSQNYHQNIVDLNFIKNYPKLNSLHLYRMKVKNLNALSMLKDTKYGKRIYFSEIRDSEDKLIADYSFLKNQKFNQITLESMSVTQEQLINLNLTVSELNVYSPWNNINWDQNPDLSGANKIRDYDKLKKDSKFKRLIVTGNYFPDIETLKVINGKFKLNLGKVNGKAVNNIYVGKYDRSNWIAGDENGYFKAEDLKKHTNYRKDNTRIFFQVKDYNGFMHIKLEEEKPKISIERIEGSSRFQTALKISDKLYTSANTAIIVNANKFPDALTSTVLSKKLKAPILLSGRNEIPESVNLKIKKLGVKNVIIVGGNLVISDKLERQLKTNYSVRRIGGRTRYETSELVANEIGGNGVVVARGDHFADALTISSLALKNDYPIYLTKPNNLSNSTFEKIKRRKPASIFIAGGFNAVNRGVENKLKTLSNVTRLGGTTRFDTSKKIAEHVYGNNVVNVMVARSDDFADAMVAGPLAYNYKAPILLVDKKGVSPEIKTYLVSRKSTIKKGYIVGGTVAVSLAIETSIKDIMK